MYIQDMNVEEKLSIETEMIAGRWSGSEQSVHGDHRRRKKTTLSTCYGQDLTHCGLDSDGPVTTELLIFLTLPSSPCTCSFCIKG